MNQNISLAIIATLSWLIITILSLLGAYLANQRNPEEERGVSIFPGLIVMPVLTFGIGFLINFFRSNLGNLIVGTILGGDVPFLVKTRGGLVSL